MQCPRKSGPVQITKSSSHKTSLPSAKSNFEMFQTKDGWLHRVTFTVSQVYDLKLTHSKWPFRKPEKNDRSEGWRTHIIIRRGKKKSSTHPHIHVSTLSFLSRSFGKLSTAWRKVSRRKDHAKHPEEPGCESREAVASARDWPGKN